MLEGLSSIGWQGSGDCDLPRGQHESLLSASSEKVEKQKQMNWKYKAVRKVGYELYLRR